MARPPLHDIAGVAEDAAHVAVGLGILLFQQAQVQRRALERSLRELARRATDSADRPTAR
jgi:hypothetical protein